MVLSIGKLSFGNQAYYLNDCVKYYAHGEEELGQWHGEGAKEIGLSRYVRRRELSNLFQGKHPVTRDPLVQNAGKRTGKRKRRPGVDYTFSDPKDVSLLIALSSATFREKALLCRDIAFHAVLNKIEQDIGYCRTGTDGTKRVQAKLILARFTHCTNRLSDCNWHDHLLILNIGVCPDGKTRSIDTRLLYKPGYIKELEAYRLRVLAKELQRRLPILCVPTQHGFQIQGFSQSIRDHFSRRRKAILRRMQLEGVEGPREADRVNIETRPDKHPTPPLPVLLDIWQKRACEQGFNIDQVFRQNKERTHQPQKDVSIEIEVPAEARTKKVLTIEPDKPESIQAGHDHETDDLPNVDNRDVGSGRPAKRELGNTQPESDPPLNNQGSQTEPVRKLNKAVDRIQRRRSLWETSSLYTNQVIRKYSKPRSALEAEIDYHIGQFRKALHKKKTTKINRDHVNRQAKQYLSTQETKLVRGIVGNHGPLQVVNISDLSSENKVLKVCNEIWEKANMEIWGFSLSRYGAAVMQEETGIRTRTFRGFQAMRKPTLDYRVKYTVKQLVKEALFSRSYPLHSFNTKNKVLVVNQAHRLNMDEMDELLQAANKCGGRIVLVGSADLREGRFTALDHVAYRASRNDCLQIRNDYLTLETKQTLTPENERKEP